MESIKIQLIPKEEIEQILPIVLILNENEKPEVVKSRVQELKNFENYFCLGVYLDNELIGCCGVWKLHKIYAGKHLEVDNVAVLPNYRGLSIGKKLIEWITEYGKENQFLSIELNVYQHNPRGVRFWEKEGFIGKGFHMIKFL